MNWLCVLRTRDRELWRLVYEGAVLAEQNVERGPSSTLWRAGVRWHDGRRERWESGDARHARDGREVRAIASEIIERRLLDGLDVGELDVEPIVRESWRKRRAKKRDGRRYKKLAVPIVLPSSSRERAEALRYAVQRYVASRDIARAAVGGLGVTGVEGESPVAPVDNNENP